MLSESQRKRALEWKPCPFCGAPIDDDDGDTGYPLNRSHTVWCLLCLKCHTCTNFTANTREECRNKWNSRSLAAQDTGESDSAMSSDNGSHSIRKSEEVSAASEVAHQHESGGVEGNAATCAGRYGNGGASALRTAHSEPETQAGLAGIKPCPLSPQWIRVRDRLPKDKQMVLLIGINFGPHENYTTDMYCGWFFDEWWHRWPHWPSPTHWMPLPPAPDEE